MGSDADLSGVLMVDLEPEAEASSVSSASPVPGGGDSDSDSDSEAGRYPEIILDYEIDTQDSEHETETQWERW
jgi:hypothetical protein